MAVDQNPGCRGAPPLLQTFVAGPLLQTLVADLCVEYCSLQGACRGGVCRRTPLSVTNLCCEMAAQACYKANVFDSLPYLHKPLPMHIYMHARTHACMHACMHAYIHTHIYTYIHTYIHTFILTYMHTCIHTYIHTRRYIHTSTQIHTYIHIHTHTPWTKQRYFSYLEAHET